VTEKCKRASFFIGQHLESAKGTLTRETELPMTNEAIETTFRQLGIETEEKRQVFRDMATAGSMMPRAAPILFQADGSKPPCDSDDAQLECDS
jgi:hypothetical protein